MQRHPTFVVLAAAVAVLAVLSGCAFEPPGGARSTGGSQGGMPAPGPAGAGDALKMAGNAQALATLKQAEITAQVYMSEVGTLESFTAAEAELREPNITWNESPFAVEDQVSIRDAQLGSVVLVYHPGFGDAICAVIDAADFAVRYGVADAATASACVGDVPGFEEINDLPNPPPGDPSDDPFADPYAGQDSYAPPGSLTGP